MFLDYKLLFHDIWNSSLVILRAWKDGCSESVKTEPDKLQTMLKG